MSSCDTHLMPREYAADIEYEYAGMINTLNYICQEAENANLELVCLHINIAIAELKEYPPSKVKTR